MILSICLIILAILLACTFALICMVETAPVREDIPDDINRKIQYAHWLREQQEATALEFVDIHEPTSDYEIDELRNVIYNDPTAEEYAACMIRIMHYRFPTNHEART
ncbi:MAG: hypothetical protein HKN35_15855 [Woeseia sp.]|nr:hypothetical protein [Woeseia sp.]